MGAQEAAAVAAQEAAAVAAQEAAAVAAQEAAAVAARVPNSTFPQKLESGPLPSS